MTYTKENKNVLIGLMVLTSSLVFGFTSSIYAAEDAAATADGKPKPPPPPPFIKAPVIDTKYTKNCKELGLEKAPKGAKRRTYALKPASFRRLERVGEAMTAEKWDEALEVLKELEAKSADRPFDKAKAHEYFGYVYLSKGQYETAIKYFRMVIDESILPVRNEQSLIRNVAGLYLAIEPAQPDKAMEIIRRWFKTAVKPKAGDYVLLGQAAVLSKLYDQAICPMRIAINLSDRPKKSWYDILVAAHYEREDFIGAATLAKERLLSFPENGKYWRQLSGLYNKNERYMDALVVLELMYKQKMFKKSSEYRNLASMYALKDMPFKAARVIEDGLKKGIVKSDEKSWKQAAGSWQVARESKKAIAAYAKAGDHSENGLNEMRIAVLYSEQEKWKNAVKYFKKALSKGGLKKSVGRVHMNMGIALFNSGKVQDALDELRKAQKFSTTKRNASQWINYVKDASKSKKT